MVYTSVQKVKTNMSQNLKPIKLVQRPNGGPLADLSDEQLMHIGELALQYPIAGV
jgi:hypothetical protein